MKSSHQIIFLLSYCMFGAVFAMEKEPNNKNKLFVMQKRFDNKDARFIDVVDHEVVDNFVGGHSIYYDNKYGVRKYQKDIISFPVKSLGLLPIENYGEKRFFNILPDYTTGDPLGNRGEILTIVDPAMRQGAIVGGTVQYHDNAVGRIYVYLGFSASNFRSFHEGRKRVYPANVMALQVIKEETEHMPRLSERHIFKGVRPFGDEDMIEEVKMQRPETESCDWDNILVRSL